MNDSKPSPTATAKPGGSAAPAAPSSVAARPAAAAASAPVTAGGSVPLFGGHRGGGKKRADGLPAGSAAALEADRAKDAERKKASREAKRVAALPAALPGASAVASAAAPDSSVALSGGVGAVLVSPTGAGAPVVPWTTRLLEKPAKLLTRILDRLRQGDIFRRLDKTNLPPEIKEEIKRDAAWKDAARDDFALCLADCATIELNKRAVAASQAHWINLGLSAGELALAHYDLCGRIDKLVLAAQAEAAKPAEEKKP